MATFDRKIFLALSRDTVLACTCLYFGLLILNTLLRGFVAVMVPLPFIGYADLAVLAFYLWVSHRQTGSTMIHS